MSGNPRDNVRNKGFWDGGAAGHAFFHEADGIRDGHVTGVQTCALPISIMGAAIPGPCGPSSPRLRPAPRNRPDKIGRASCRERGYMYWEAGARIKKWKRDNG